MKNGFKIACCEYVCYKVYTRDNAKPVRTFYRKQPSTMKPQLTRYIRTFRIS